MLTLLDSMAKLHTILISGTLGLLVGAGSAALAIGPAPTFEPLAHDDCKAALVQRIGHLEDEVFTLGSLVDFYQNEPRPSYPEEPIDPDLQDALDVLDWALSCA
jgi:hypothetical protein